MAFREVPYSEGVCTGIMGLGSDHSRVERAIMWSIKQIVVMPTRQTTLENQLKTSVPPPVQKISTDLIQIPEQLISPILITAIQFAHLTILALSDCSIRVFKL